MFEPFKSDLDVDINLKCKVQSQHVATVLPCFPSQQEMCKKNSLHLVVLLDKDPAFYPHPGEERAVAGAGLRRGDPPGALG